MNVEKLKRRASKHNIILDEDYKAILKMKVTDDSSFLSTYYFDEPIVSSEVKDYLFSYKVRLAWKQGVKIEIISDVIKKEDEKIYDAAIRNAFFKELEKMKKKNIMTNILSLIMFLLGVISLIVLFLFDMIQDGNFGIWKEVIDIIAWVFIWESVDLFVIQRLENFYTYRMAKNVTTSKIVFKKLSDE